jgi:sulfur-oxidizing protein SoxX
VEPVPYVIEDLAVNTPLTDTPGDSARGREIVRDAANATCLICHAMPIPEEPDHGDIGPPLAGVASRYGEGELRLRLIDPQKINPDSVMPGYYKLEGLHRVDIPYVGKTIYTAQQIEDVLAYLLTLREE